MARTEPESTLSARPTSESWMRRFHAPSVSVLEIASRGHGRAIVGYSVGGVPQLHAWASERAELRQLTDRAGGFPWGSRLAISADGDRFAYFDDDEGTEVGRWITQSFSGEGTSVTAPELGSVSSFSLVFDHSATRVAFDTHSAEQTLMEIVDLGGDRPASRQQIALEGFVIPASFLPSGALAVQQYRDDGAWAVIVVDVASGEEVGRLDDPGVHYTAWKAGPIDGPDWLLAATDATGLRVPFLWEPSTNRRDFLDVGSIEGDVRAVDWSPGGRQILLWQAREAVGNLYVHDLETSRTRQLAVPAGTVGAMPYAFAMGFISDDEVLARWEDVDHAPTLLRIPLDGGPSSVALPTAPLPVGQPWRSVRFASADGTSIQGWLATPPGNGPHPALVDIHGGPNMSQGDGFAPLLQAFVDRGYAVLSVNYRGSTTFGRGFEDAINGGAGRLEVEDVVAGRDWLVAEGIARPDSILVEGVSYGGYLTLLALGSRPDCWAGGIAFIAIGDSVAAWEDTGEAMRVLDVMTFGGPPEDVPDSWRRGSPMTYAADVAAPVLVFNGRNDSRCPARQMERYEARLRELGKNIEVVWFESGHLGPGADTSVAQAETSLAFVDRIMNTRATPA